MLVSLDMAAKEIERLKEGILLLCECSSENVGNFSFLGSKLSKDPNEIHEAKTRI